MKGQLLTTVKVRAAAPVTKVRAMAAAKFFMATGKRVAGEKCWMQERNLVL